MHESSYKAGSGRRYQAGQGHPGRVPRILATVVAVIALIVGGLALVRAVAPHAIAKLTAVSVRSLAIGAAALIVVAIILIVMARVASRRGNRVSVRGTAGGAIVAVVFAIMLTVAALLISNLFKDGIVKPEDVNGFASDIYRESQRLIALAEDIIANRAKYSEVCKGKKLATLFYEPSTRTRLSFTSAMLELGGSVIGFSDAASSSVSKGETVADTVRVIRCFADIIAMRHFKEGAPLVGSQYAGIPVINAGDGSHSHPTQTLTDLLTIKREKGRLDHLTIGFCGDLKFGRTVHSLIKAMSRYEGIRVVLIAPDELRLPEYMLHEIETQTEGVEFREVSTMEEVMPELDILYMTRVQKERFLDEEEFNRVKDSFVLDPSKLRTAKPDMIVLHPLPRVNEITRAVDNDPRVAYFRQVENGKFVRMALIYTLLKWAEGEKLAAVPDLAEGMFIDRSMKCPNSRCISATEDVDPLFVKAGDTCRCAYCEAKIR